MSRFHIRWAFASSLFLFGLQSHSASIHPDSFWYKFSQGFRSDADVVIFPKSSNPSPLPVSKESEWAPEVARLNRQIADLVSDSSTRIVVIAHRRQIVSEHYSSRWLRQSTPLGFSMSKSITALAVGRAICDGKIEQPNLPTATYLPTLKGSSWGDASVYDILGMRSGAAKTSSNGWQSDTAQNEASGLYTGTMKTDFFELFNRFDSRFAKPGTDYQYNNLDTIALSVLLGSRTGDLAKYFQETVWEDVGAESDGSWLKNKHSQLAGYTGFSASPNDWIRIGFSVLDRMKRADCYGMFLNQAITKVSKAEEPARCYGYQIWTWCKDPGAFFFTGAEGQYLIMFPNNEIVAYVHQINEENTRKLLPLIHQYRRLLR